MSARGHWVHDDRYGKLAESFGRFAECWLEGDVRGYHRCRRLFEVEPGLPGVASIPNQTIAEPRWR